MNEQASTQLCLGELVSNFVSEVWLERLKRGRWPIQPPEASLSPPGSAVTSSCPSPSEVTWALRVEHGATQGLSLWLGGPVISLWSLLYKGLFFLSVRICQASWRDNWEGFSPKYTGNMKMIMSLIRSFPGQQVLVRGLLWGSQRLLVPAN